jgi:hypothetical protein
MYTIIGTGRKPLAIARVFFRQMGMPPFRDREWISRGIIQTRPPVSRDFL